MRRVAERNIGEVDRILRADFDERDNPAPISRAELVRRLKDGAVTVLDVRPEDEFAAGRVPGAPSPPLDRLGLELPRLGHEHEIVAYRRRGSHCARSFEAAAELRKSGFRARRPEDGFPEWKAEGLAFEPGASTEASLAPPVRG